MNSAKLAEAVVELRATINSVIIFPLPILKKEILDNSFVIDKPRTAEEWLTKTNYHPDRGIVVSVSREYESIMSPGDIVYFDGNRMKNFTPILHNKEVYLRVGIGDILCVIMGGAAKEYTFEDLISKKEIIN